MRKTEPNIRHDAKTVVQLSSKPSWRSKNFTRISVRVKFKSRGGIIAANEHLSVQLLQSNLFELLACPVALAQWINRQLGLYAHNGVSQNHWGIVRLAHWMNNRMQSGTGNRINRQEFFIKGKQWLPAFFDRIPFRPEVLPIQHLQNDTIAVNVLYPDTHEKPVPTGES